MRDIKEPERTIADVVEEIRQLEARLPALKKARDEARDNLSRAECSLESLKGEFTRLAAGLIDRETLDRERPDHRERVSVTP